MRFTQTLLFRPPRDETAKRYSPTDELFILAKLGIPVHQHDDLTVHQRTRLLQLFHDEREADRSFKKTLLEAIDRLAKARSI